MKRRTILTLGASVVGLAALTAGGLVAAGLNNAGPWAFLHSWEGEVSAIQQKYDPEQRSGEVVFYGASNFARWTDMEQDLHQYRVQNHGFGGSTTADLITYADRLLYPYDPAVVVFQTGSNDYAGMTGTDPSEVDALFAEKERLFADVHAHLPNAQLIVMSGLLLPGRSQHTELGQRLNDKLAALANTLDYMTFVDAEALTYDGANYDTDKFVSDGIHLTPEARREWAAEYIAPAIEQVAQNNHLDTIRSK